MGLSIGFIVKILKYYFLKGIDKAIQSMVSYSVMTEVQNKLAQLKEKGWTWAAIATEFGITPNAVEKWNAEQRKPSKADLLFLEQLLKRKRIPKKRRYAEGTRKRIEKETFK